MTASLFVVCLVLQFEFVIDWYLQLMYKRKAFFRCPSTLDMDEMDFNEAQSNVKDLLSEYQQYQEAEESNEEAD